MKRGLLRAPGAGLSGVACGLLLAAAGVMAALASGVGLRRVLMLLVLGPLLEETVFRAGMQEALLRRWPRSPHADNLATALAFGLAHALVRAEAGAVAAALPALLIGAVYQRTGRLRYCVLLHAAMNAAWLAWNLAPSARLAYR